MNIFLRQDREFFLLKLHKVWSGVVHDYSFQAMVVKDSEYVFAHFSVKFPVLAFYDLIHCLTVDYE